MRKLLIGIGLFVSGIGTVHAASVKQPVSVAPFTVVQSSFTMFPAVRLSSGTLSLWTTKLATAITLIPTNTGQMLICDDCVDGRLAISTGIGRGAFVIIPTTATNNIK